MVMLQGKERKVPRILMMEHLAQAGLDLLRRELPEALIDLRVGLAPAQLRAVLGGYTVLIVDSNTRVTDDLLAVAPRLQLIGHAGSSVDNIDLEAASRRGVLVVYAPGGDVLALADGSLDQGGTGTGGDGGCQECRLGAAGRHPHRRHPALVPTHSSFLAKRCLNSTVLPHRVASALSAF